MAVGAVAGALGSLFGDSAQNEALEEQQRARISIYKNKEMLAGFAIRNNNQRVDEILTQYAAEEAEAGREVIVEERKAIGTETIRRGEGLTAGASIQRSVDDVIQKGNKAKAEIQKKATDRFMQLASTARDANARELAQIDDAYHSTVAGIAADQAQKKSGAEMLFGAAMAGASGALTGANVGAAFKIK